MLVQVCAKSLAECYDLFMVGDLSRVTGRAKIAVTASWGAMSGWLVLAPGSDGSCLVLGLGDPNRFFEEGEVIEVLSDFAGSPHSAWQR